MPEHRGLLDKQCDVIPSLCWYPAIESSVVMVRLDIILEDDRIFWNSGCWHWKNPARKKFLWHDVARVMVFVTLFCSEWSDHLFLSFDFTTSLPVLIREQSTSFSSIKITDCSYRYVSPCLWNKLPATFRQPHPDHSRSYSPHSTHP